MPKGFPLTDEEQARRRREIFEAAGRLLLKKGFNETSMREIATVAGVGKSTLYDYFPTKDDILVLVFQEELEKLIRRATAIATQRNGVPEKLYQIMQMHLDFLMANKNHFLRLSMQLERLNQASQRRVQEKRYAYQDLLRDVIAQGIADGSLRQINPTITAKVLLALMMPVLFTSRPVGTPQAMLLESMSIVMDGIRTGADVR